jgi:nucleotide-binding universal stress UspA family protein
MVAGVDYAGAGLPTARWAAIHLKPSKVILVNAVHLVGVSRFLEGLLGDEDQLQAAARSGAERRMSEYAETLAEHTGVPTEALVRTGAPAELIGEIVDEVDADLVAVGPHARRKGRWSLLGSTAAQLLHEARVPTLVGRGGLEGPPDRVLGAVDESGVAAGVLKWTKSVAAAAHQAPTLIHVLDYPLEAHMRAIEPPRSDGEVEAKLEAPVREWLTESAREAGLPENTHFKVALGEPAFEILAAADRYAIDLIVMGTHGAGSITRAFMGSVADAVLRRAPCPVLALPAHQ